MWILIVQSAYDMRWEYSFKSEKVTLGRDPDNTITLTDLHSSRYHAEIYFEDGVTNPIIRDLESTNGTFVNAETVSEPRKLNPEDQIRIGTYVLTLVASDTESFPQQRAFRPDDTIDNKLLFESLESYAVLVYKLEKMLAMATDLDAVLTETSGFIAQSTNASACHVLLKESFDDFKKLKLPSEVQPLLVENDSPRLISNPEVLARRYRSLIVIPVRVHTYLEAIIYVVRERKISHSFDMRDLQLAIAASHQLALVIQQKRHEQIIVKNINHDPLTQLPNRNLLRERIQEAIDNHNKDPRNSYALLFLDLDEFKLVNDSLGHPAGDELLVVLSRRFRSLLLPNQTIARFGGDEFAILVNDFGTEEEIAELATSILKEIAKPITIRDTEMHVSGSLGITTSALDYESANELIRDADIAMYRAKEEGGDSFQIFNEAMRDIILERISLNNDLRAAIKNHEFQLHYQPILSLSEMRIVGFEALIRWQSPHRGFMKPGNFLIESITTGLLRSIDDWVLQTACRQATGWQPAWAGETPLFISVNLSGKQLNRPDLVETIEEFLHSSTLPPDRLWLEITENTVFGYEKQVIQSMQKLRDLGVHFSLDDFGTGYSTFSYLYRLPIDVLKIDRTFINEFSKDKGKQKIIRVLIDLGRNLGLRVVAEGIETKPQHEMLKNLNCEFGQGYYFSRPLTVQGVEGLLKSDGLITR